MFVFNLLLLNMVKSIGYFITASLFFMVKKRVSPYKALYLHPQKIEQIECKRKFYFHFAEMQSVFVLQK